jgi:hypothetical protein
VANRDLLKYDPFGGADYPHITIAYGPPILQKWGEIEKYPDPNQ